MRISPGVLCVVVLAGAVLCAAIVTATATSIAGREAVPVVIADQPRFQIIEVKQGTAQVPDFPCTFMLDRQTGRIWEWRLWVDKEKDYRVKGWLLVYVESIEEGTPLLQPMDSPAQP